MKRKLLKLTTILVLFWGLSTTGCTGYSDSSSLGEDATMGEGATDEGGGNDQSHAGIVTAGEWNDLSNWGFWGKLMNHNNFIDNSSFWDFYTNNLLVIHVENSLGKSLNNVKVELKRNETTIWQAVTDNSGIANLWVGLNQKENTVDPSKLTVTINGELQTGELRLTSWSDENVRLNKYTVYVSKEVPKIADIAFIVDGTGSMSDEITFLKEDLKNIIKQVSGLQTDITIRTASLFYRDIGDDYLTKHSNFSEDTDVTHSFISEQEADGGGDYPEAVHTALEHTLQNLSWSEDATSRLAFMLLDAPAHKKDEVLKSLHSSIKMFAAKGIKVIPISASGINKNTEFMLRFFALSTGGTYVFITNHSGVGNDHIEPSVGEYQVEQLNSLIVRLINKYTDN